MLPFRIVRKTTRLTNAQIKALPTTPITVKSSGGPGTILLPVSATYAARFDAAGYTNVDIGATLHIRFAGDSGSQLAPGRFIPTAGQWHHGSIGFSHRAQLGGQYSSALAFALLGFDDTALTVAMANASLGNLTGGNSANTLAVQIDYIVLDNPAVLRVVAGQWVIDDDPSGASPDGYLTSTDGGATLIISRTAERGLALTITDDIPEASYP